MAKKKTEELEESTPADAVDNAEETAIEAQAADETVLEAAPAEQATPAEDTTEAVETAPVKEAKPKKAAAKKKEAKPAEKADSEDEGAKTSKRAEKIGVVASDKMTKTVVVRVDRLVKHPIYRKYVRKRKKFMAHDDLGSKIGDKVRIVETRPLSARKRWRVVEILQKAEL
jgi:small subunit ribosomal protein S17